MIFNVSSPSGGKTPVYPQYTGTMNFVNLSGDGTSGFAEFTSSGVLTWAEGSAPRTKFDLFCVGGGASGNGVNYDTGGAAGGGGGGYTTTVIGAKLGKSVEIEIGAGGASVPGRKLGNDGGETNIGGLCVAAGGKHGSSFGVGGNGGSGGGGSVEYNGAGGAGGTNGGNGAAGVRASSAGAVAYGGGSGQGTPTTDPLGRVHAGGGGGLGRNGGAGGQGGASDFAGGKGGNSQSPSGYESGTAYGGGGYGGGGAGGTYAYGATSYVSGAGGQGFAMIAWGDYKEIYNRVTELEYIESTGTQYIDTGYVASENTKIVIKGAPSATGALYCAVSGAQRCGVYMFNGNIDMAFGGTGYRSATKSVSYPETVTLQNGALISSSGTHSFETQNAFRASAALPLFREGETNSPGGRIYFVQIYEGDELVLDLVPAVRVRDNAIGLYDRVGEKLYTNAGTGQFTIGVKAENVTELEYMGVTGSQWIDTGYTPLSDDVVYECAWTETALNSNCTLFGSQNTSSSNKFSAVQYKPNATSMYSATGATDALGTINNIAANVRNTLTVTVKNGTVTRVQNGTTASGAYGGTIKNGLNVFLFADNVNGNANERCNAVRIHSWKVTDGGVLLHDLIPATAFGVVGFYDRVSKRMYTNAGTGNFVVGGEV